MHGNDLHSLVFLLAGSLASPSTTQTCPTWGAAPDRSSWAGPGASPSSGTCSHRSKITTPVNKPPPVSSRQRGHSPTRTTENQLSLSLVTLAHQDTSAASRQHLTHQELEGFSTLSTTWAGKISSFSQVSPGFGEGNCEFCF